MTAQPMSERGARLAHAFLDLAYAQDIDQTAEDLTATIAALGSLRDAGLSNLFRVWSDGRADFETRPVIEAVAYPMLLLLREIADLTGSDLEDVLADMRTVIDEQRGDRSR